MDSRQYHDLRARIDDLITQGWRITGRDPIRLERGQVVKVVRGRAVIDG